MNRPEIDETLLTAYALGELDARERARVAAHVEADAEARRQVEDVCDAAAMVTDGMRSEPVEELLAIRREMIERRLGEARTRKVASRGVRLRRWIPVAASLAASIAIVGGLAVVLLPKLRGPIATDHRASSDHGSGVTVIGPGQAAEAPTSPDAPPHVADGEETQTPGEFPQDTDVAHGGDADEGPADGRRDPREASADRGSDLAERPEAPAAPAPRPAATPMDPEPRLADGRGPAHSPEAEDIRAREERERKMQQAATPPVTKGKPAPKVYVSPPRDPAAFEEIRNRPAPADLTRIFENPFRAATDRPRSAFPVRVERWSFVTVRNSLGERQMPPPVRVRIEELVNYFAYDYPSPSVDGPPIAVSVEVATCPWDTGHRLARVAIKAREGGATVVAQGVEAAVEFNPQATSKWRLVGYENSPAASQPKTFPFDLAAGGTATALYEIIPHGAEARPASPKDLFTVKVTYREPGDAAGSAARTLASAATDTGGGFDRAGEDFRFATSVAAFGLLLRDSQFKGTATYADVIRWATAGKGADATNERQGLIDLVKVARDLDR